MNSFKSLILGNSQKDTNLIFKYISNAKYLTKGLKDSDTNNYSSAFHIDLNKKYPFPNI